MRQRFYALAAAALESEPRVAMVFAEIGVAEMPPPLGRAGGAIPGPPAGAMGAGGAALASLDDGASLGPRAGVGPPVPGGSEVSSGGATTEATSPVPAGGAGIAA